MRRLVFYSLFLLLFIVIAYYFTLRITGFFVGFGPPQGNFEWWNVSWRYRFKIEINSSIYERNNWPIEIEINFTDFLPSGTFDENSTRVLEYDESGNMLYEVPSQFDKSDDFNSSSNAIGTLIFLLNGTTQANQKRIFYVYYDVIENGKKEKPSYPTNLSYSWDGKEIIVNTSFSFYNIDTNRGENTSGLYKVKRITGDVIFLVQSEIDRTTEYIEYSNGSSLGFYLNNIDFIPGPIRLTIKQVGDEIIFGNPNQKTNEGKMTKKYYFYDLAGPEEYGSFVKIEQNFTNVANYEIYRNSTKAGALAFDLNRSFYQGISDLEKSSSEPYSWVWASNPPGYLVGVLNLNETNTNNFFVENDTELGRIGVQLNETLINQNSWIYQKSLVYFGIGGASGTTEFSDIVNRYSTPPQISISLPERLYVSLEPTTNATIYNRNESVLIKLNITDDPYNLTAYVNASLDMGTSSGSDDVTLILYDDGTHGDEEAGDKIFSNIFDITNDAYLGIWAINFTVYSEKYEFLNFTIYNFNVTDLLNVTVEIQNKKPMIGGIVKANIYVKNYRQDSFIQGAEINCTYDSFEVENKTDYNNGTYSVNFTAPSEEGTYTLICNASKNGNFGNGTDTFTTEPGKTNVSLKIQPENPLVEGVTFYKGNSFEVNVNASNIGNGTAYSVNISLELINGWQANSSLEECGEIEKGSFCLKGFNISVPKATYPG
ncbi:MAG: choice-of-anchor X domain-containing protein, partial [Candidatus Aenigmatarchaeota archaeon]